VVWHNGLVRCGTVEFGLARQCLVGYGSVDIGKVRFGIGVRLCAIKSGSVKWGMMKCGMVSHNGKVK